MSRSAAFHDIATTFVPPQGEAHKAKAILLVRSMLVS
jgi:hypothetical protein